jgi:hypothetical protein
MTPKNASKKEDSAKAQGRLLRVAQAFADDRSVRQQEKKGFGSGALKVNGRIFAMMSSKNKFVVKLPKCRVDELVSTGHGERFDLGHGRIMKEWFVLEPGRKNWAELAKEACEFVKGLK